MSSSNTFAVLFESDADKLSSTSSRKTTWADETQEEVDRAAAAGVEAEAETTVVADEKAVEVGGSIARTENTPLAEETSLAAETPLVVLPESDSDDSKPSAFPDSWDEYMESMPVIAALDSQATSDWEYAAECEARDWFGAGISHEENDAITAEDLQCIHEEAEKTKQSEVTPSSPAGGSTTSNPEDTDDLQESGFEFNELEDSTDATEEDGIYTNDVGDLLDYISDADADTVVPSGCVDTGDLLAATKEVTGASAVERLLPEILDEAASPPDSDPPEDVTDASKADKHVTHASDGDESSVEGKQNVSLTPVVTRKRNYRTKAERAQAKKRTAAAATALENDQESDQKVGSGLSEQDILEAYTASRANEPSVENQASNTHRRKARKSSGSVAAAEMLNAPAARRMSTRMIADMASRYDGATCNLPWFIVLGLALVLLAALGAVLHEFEMI